MSKDYLKDIEINEYALDKEWLKQPALYLSYSEMQIRAKDHANQAKQNAEIILAEEATKIRIKAEKEGDKITENIVRERSLSSKEYKKAIANYYEVLEEANILGAVVAAFEQRKYALDNLVKLQISGYNANMPNIKDDEAGFSEKRTDRQKDALNKKTKRS